MLDIWEREIFDMSSASRTPSSRATPSEASTRRSSSSPTSREPGQLSIHPLLLATTTPSNSLYSPPPAASPRTGLSVRSGVTSRPGREGGQALTTDVSFWVLPISPCRFCGSIGFKPTGPTLSIGLLAPPQSESKGVLGHSWVTHRNLSNVLMRPFGEQR